MIKYEGTTNLWYKLKSLRYEIQQKIGPVSGLPIYNVIEVKKCVRRYINMYYILLENHVRYVRGNNLTEENVCPANREPSYCSESEYQIYTERNIVIRDGQTCAILFWNYFCICTHIHT